MGGSLLLQLALLASATSRHSSDLVRCAHWRDWLEHLLVATLHTLSSFNFALLLRNLFNVADYVGTTTKRYKS